LAWYLKQVKAEDLIAYGFESEFVGRLPVTVSLESLGEEDLYQILRNPNCPVIVGKRADFKAYGIDIYFEDEAFRKLAALAHKEQTGARGLTSVVESTLMKFEKKLPSTTICRLVVTPEMVDDPVAELEKLLARPDDPVCQERFEALAARERRQIAEGLLRRAEEFESKYGFYPEGTLLDLAVGRVIEKGVEEDEAVLFLKGLSDGIELFREDFREKNELSITFTPEALEELLIKAAEEGDAAALCRRLFANYPLGLQLMHEKSGHTSFELDAEAVREPDKYLDRAIKEKYAG
jgi:hypothetical protein